MRHVLLVLLLLAPWAGCRSAEKSTRSVLGKVIDIDARPIPDMPVTLTVEAKGGERKFRAESEASGWFVFHGIPPGKAVCETTDPLGRRVWRDVRSGMVLLLVEGIGGVGPGKEKPAKEEEPPQRPATERETAEPPLAEEAPGGEAGSPPAEPPPTAPPSEAPPESSKEEPANAPGEKPAEPAAEPPAEPPAAPEPAEKPPEEAPPEKPAEAAPETPGEQPAEPPPATPPVKPALFLDGKVTFSGLAIEGVSLEAIPAEGDGAESATTDAAGQFSIGGLAQGEYRVRVTLPASAKDRDGAWIVCPRDYGVLARPGEPLAIDLPAGASVEIATNFPSVSIDTDGVVARRYDTPESGKLVLRGFPQGSVRLLFHKPDGTVVPYEEKIGADATLKVEMRLPE